VIRSIRVPAVLYGVALLAAGILAPTVIARPARAPAGTVGMRHEKFSQERVTVRRGATLTFVNDSGWLHVVGPGDEGRIGTQPGSPRMGARGAFVSESGATFATGPWNTPGTYHITCSLHPEMNITVVVTG
jgi:plastocyanin